MTIRPADDSDVEAIADLLADGRVRQQAWDPDFWAIAPDARQVHPMFLSMVVCHGATIARVHDGPGAGPDAVAIATPLSDASNGRGMAWVIDDFAVSRVHDWGRLGPPLLAAIAGRARSLGGQWLVVGCPHLDRDRSEMLASAGFEIDGWYRHLRHGAPTTAPEIPGPESEDLPLPVLHGMLPVLADAEPVVGDRAAGRRTGPLAAPPVYRPGGTTTLVDSVAAVDASAVDGFIERLESDSRDRGDVGLLVVAGPAQPALDRTLDRRGYGRLIDWWALRLC